jgi:hypothetical protein
VTATIRNKHTIAVISDKDNDNNICVFMSKSKFPKNEIRSTDGIAMKKLFTIKLSVVSNHSVDISRDRGVTINTGRTRREEKKGKNERKQTGKIGKRQ